MSSATVLQLMHDTWSITKGEDAQSGPQGYKKNFKLNSAEHDICPANKSQI